MSQQKDALRVLRLTARRVRSCEHAVEEALKRPEEIRRLELDTLSEAVEGLRRTVHRALQAFPSANPRAAS